ncbi:MAG TPA: OmpA family protein [bacterium]|nr:OmpA family protein [bacterium]HPN42325.1 OmpA family protein [bacterium]
MLRKFAGKDLTFSLFLLLIILIIVTSLPAADKEELISGPELQARLDSIEIKYQAAKQAQAGFYATKYMSLGEELYKKINDNKNKTQGLPLKDINLVQSLFEKAQVAAVLMKSNYDQYLTSRAYGDSIGASTFDSKGWEKAEKKFEKTITCLENGRNEEALKTIQEADALFKQVIIAFLNNKYIIDIDNKIQAIEKAGIKNNAPISLQKTKMMLQKTKSQLNKDKKESGEFLALVKTTLQEIEHASEINKCVIQTKDDKNTLEQLRLNEESTLQQIASKFDFTLDCSKGKDNAVNSLLNQIDEEKKKYQNFEYALAEKDKQILELQTNNTQYKNHINHLTVVQDSLTMTFRKIGSLASDIVPIQNALDSTDIISYYDKEKIILRLPGKVFIEKQNYPNPKYFAALTKISKALKNLNNCLFTIEGHATLDSKAEINKSNSQEKANAIRDYLTADGRNIQDYIAIGFGNSKPIAPDNKEGKILNNRIDIVIQRKN